MYDNLGRAGLGGGGSTGNDKKPPVYCDGVARFKGSKGAFRYDGATFADEDADVEKFLKKGILDMIPPSFVCEDAACCTIDCCRSGFRGSEDSETVEASPSCARTGPSPRFISPKYCSASFTEVEWSTPAKATTILSGLKNSLWYFPITSRLMNSNRSLGQSNGFPSVLFLYAAI